MPMGMAEIAEVLWRRHLRHNPTDPRWFDRDRFVLSNGHGSMLLYALLHLTGYGVSLEDLKRFRQLHSQTPGHPEHGVTPGVETTTGPLGQGIANAVGMAIAETAPRSANSIVPASNVIDHYTYVFVGDGCMMEGISHEACSLAGTLGLGKLIAFYDDNGISIDGHVSGWFTDDTPKRFEAYGWHVVADVDGHDSDAIDRAIREAKAATTKPSLICCKTVIAKGSPNKAGTHDAHGAPLGEKEIAATRAAIEWDYAPFEIPAHVYELWDARGKGVVLRALLEPNDGRVRALVSARGRRIEETHARRAAGGFRRVRTRAHDQDASESVEHRDAQGVTGGHRGSCADPARARSAVRRIWQAPTSPQWSGSRAVTASSGGNYLHYGVREFGMAAIMNGLALHGGFIPYGGTFLAFSDYCRNALRMAALMRVRSLFVFTHDSIGLGEDGPTHQPIEQLASLRLIPNMDVWRPCDTLESVVAWAAALERTDGPTSLVFSRQNLPFQSRPAGAEEAIRRGGYVLVEPLEQPAGSPHRDGLGSGARGRGAASAGEQRCPGARRVDAIDDGVRSSAR